MRPAKKFYRQLSPHVRGMLKSTLRQRRKDTVYRMLFKRHNGTVPCFVCGGHVMRPAATLEHIKPVSRGGTDDISNLSISHAKCNVARGAPE